MQQNQIVNLRLTPLNENQSINYCETFRGTFKQLTARLMAMVNGLQTSLPEGTFTVNLQDIETGEDWYFIRGKFYDTDYYEVRDNVLAVFDAFKEIQKLQLN